MDATSTASASPLLRYLHSWRWPAAPATGAAAVFSPKQCLALLAGFLLVVALRIPHAWAHGRLMDEEGTIFFAYAWHRPALDALLRSFGGYLNIGANGATLVAVLLVRAGLLSLEHAPYLTMAMALAFQSLPAVLILTGRGRWLANRAAVIAALLLIAICPAVEEVFFNVLHIQFHLALATGLVLALEVPASRIGRIGHCAILFAAPLCGPGAIVLLPFFGLRTLIDRDYGRLAQTSVFTCGVALQLLVFFTPSPLRGTLLHPATLLSILCVRLIALPYAGWSKANKFGRFVYASYTGGGAGWWIAVAVAVAVIWFVVLVLLAWRYRRTPAIWLIVPGLALGAASFGGGMINSDPSDWWSVGAGERYNFLPLVLLSLGTIVLARSAAGRARWFYIALVGLTLLAGAKKYPKPIDELADGPVWSVEVAKWRADHDHPLASWPAAWSVDLSDRHRPCSPPRADGLPTADPSYCESHWLTRVIENTRRAALQKP